MSIVFVHTVKCQNGSFWLIDRALSGASTTSQSGPVSDDNEGYTPHYPKLRHHWKLTIILFIVISRALVVRPLTPLQRCNRCNLQPQPTGQCRGLRPSKKNVLSMALKCIRWKGINLSWPLLSSPLWHREAISTRVLSTGWIDLLKKQLAFDKNTCNNNKVFVLIIGIWFTKGYYC